MKSSLRALFLLSYFFNYSHSTKVKFVAGGILIQNLRRVILTRRTWMSIILRFHPSLPNTLHRIGNQGEADKFTLYSEVCKRFDKKWGNG